MINNVSTNNTVLNTKKNDQVTTQTSGGGDKTDPPTVNKSFSDEMDAALMTSGGGDKTNPPD